jgi:hypothetical protein
MMGGKCVHCGFDDERALQVDHIEGGGRAEDDYRAYVLRVWEHPEKYQLLCANCNWIKRDENEELYRERKVDTASGSGRVIEEEEPAVEAEAETIRGRFKFSEVAYESD